MRKSKGKKDDDKTVKPSRAIGAYFYFSGEFVPKIKEKEGISHIEATKRSGEEWGKMSDKDKEPFMKSHLKDQKR